MGLFIGGIIVGLGIGAAAIIIILNKVIAPPRW
jgi:hypothetical protein